MKVVGVQVQERLASRVRMHIKKITIVIAGIAGIAGIAVIVTICDHPRAATYIPGSHSNSDKLRRMNSHKKYDRS